MATWYYLAHRLLLYIYIYEIHIYGWMDGCCPFLGRDQHRRKIYIRSQRISLLAITLLYVYGETSGDELKMRENRRLWLIRSDVTMLLVDESGGQSLYLYSQRKRPLYILQERIYAAGSNLFKDLGFLFFIIYIQQGMSTIYQCAEEINLLLWSAFVGLTQQRDDDKLNLGKFTSSLYRLVFLQYIVYYYTYSFCLLCDGHVLIVQTTL